jgi:hypothetical protein
MLVWKCKYCDKVSREIDSETQMPKFGNHLSDGNGWLSVKWCVDGLWAITVHFCSFKCAMLGMMTRAVHDKTWPHGLP